jgi:hypothetical protein
MGHPEVLSHVEQTCFWAPMKIRERAELGRREERVPLPAQLFVNSTHDLGKGLQHCRRTLVSEVQDAHRNLLSRS